MEKYCPVKKVGSTKKYYRTKQPYWKNELNELWLKLCSAERTSLKCSPRDPQKRRALHSEFKQCQVNFDRKLRFFKRRFKRGQALKLEQLQTGNPQLFWREIHKLGPKKKMLIPMEVLLENGGSSFESGQILKKWEKDYSNLYAYSSSTLFDDNFLEETCKVKLEMETGMNTIYHQNDILNSEITLDEVLKVLDKAKENKAVGIEDLPNEVLTNPNLCNALYCLCYICFHNGIIPSVWNRSIIKPIPKSIKDDPRVQLNYRGISLISTVYKIYSGVLNNRLNNFLESHGGLVDEQIGFRKNRACIYHIFVSSSVVRARLEKGKSTFACFVDFKKVFDCVNRDLLLFKLLSSGINGKFYNAIKALYRDPIACVQINNLRTDWFPTPFGVKQGDLLSPSLFTLYINDLAQEIKQVNLGVRIEDMNLSILLYADDIVLIAENEVNLQNMLNIMSSWCSKWHLTINSEKTQVVHFRKKSEVQSNHTFQFQSVPLKYTCRYKYLGFVFDEYMKFAEGRKILAESARRALGSVLSKMKSCTDLGFSTFTHLYKSLVDSVLFYAAGVWGFEEAFNCNSVQNHALRCFLGVHKYAAKGSY